MAMPAPSGPPSAPSSAPHAASSAAERAHGPALPPSAPLRSALFTAVFYGWTAVACLTLWWVQLLPRPQVLGVVRWYLGTIGWLERHLLGLRWELRGAENLVPGPCLIAAKHQAAWETLKLHALFGDPAIVHKVELLRLPIWGGFLKRIDMIPVDRGAGGRAIRSLVAGAQRMAVQGRPIVIFPQGTRVAVGAGGLYKPGLGYLYDNLQLPVVPVALNSGLFWGRGTFGKRPGTIVVEMLPPLPAGLPRDEMMAKLERVLESATDRLVAAAKPAPEG